MDAKQRRSIRLKEYDYSQEGAYFVTLCSYRRQCLFGGVENESVTLSTLGQIVDHEWRRTSEIRQNVSIDEFVVMPNHLHGIIMIRDLVGATRRVAQSPDTTKERATRRVAPTRPAANSIGAILAQYKSVVTKLARKLAGDPSLQVWQLDYYEHVIRNDDVLTRACEYILNNPLSWSLDSENPEHVKPQHEEYA